ncbi:hypothetical protein M378DRAFT_15592 [Amanita muscaria Koide BX008]|uniref:Uncharacterized protein n=1 Tax=Amanita muscaria (strain Koide BX008) TaxID=946122 RepID=A0A0C2WQ90_AMAMK|nr:hypothetical protein M378DRAFT_15592 [Amanita muscaria Koide BX008]
MIIGAKPADVQDEIGAAFEDCIPIKGDKGIEFPAYVYDHRAGQATGSLSLCRDPDWMGLNKKFTLDMGKASIFLSVIPAALGIEHGTKHLEPLIKERVRNTGRQNDVISWTFDVTREGKNYPFGMIKAILMTNLVAIHTTTMTLTTLMYGLTKHQGYTTFALRDRDSDCSRRVVKEFGSRAVSSKSLRLSDMGLFLMSRQALKDLTFRNSMTRPAGSIVSVPFLPPDAQSFNGFRFEKTRSQEGEEHKQQHVTAGADYILFGHGTSWMPWPLFVIKEVMLVFSSLRVAI